MRSHLRDMGPSPQPVPPGERATAIAPPLALYIHIPWCVKKCPYCDFNSHGLRGELPVGNYVGALLADLDGDLRDFDSALRERQIVSVFFGGGTPSLFPPHAIAAILEGASTRMPFASDCEITLETNPGTVEHGRFEGYLGAGVNRISFGVQSFDDDKLHALGRIHSSGEAEHAVKLAQDAGYTNINLDLMYALPRQTLQGALADLEHAIALQPSHISHYQLTLEPGTPFAKCPPPVPDEDDAWSIQEACQQRLANAGFGQYEVSAYAQPGYRCAHNLNYWRFGDYLGIGAGAHGKITGVEPATHGPPDRDPEIALGRNFAQASAMAAIRNPSAASDDATWIPGSGRQQRAQPRNNDTHFQASAAGAGGSRLHVQRRSKVRSPLAYLQSAAGGQRTRDDEVVAADQLPFEFMLNALRLNDGIALDDFVARTGLPLDAVAAPLATARRRGWLIDDSGIIQATPLGRRFLNDVIESFLPEPYSRCHHA